MRFKRASVLALVLLLPLFYSSAQERVSRGAVLFRAVDPHQPNSIWEIAEAGLFRSDNGGTRWTAVPVDLPADGRITGVWTFRGSVFLDTNTRGLLQSTDAGLTWHGANEGLPQGLGGQEVTPIRAIATSEETEAPLYALTETQGVFRSSNNGRTWGRTWQNASTGLPVPLIHRTEGSLLAVHPGDARRIYTLLNVPVTSHRNSSILLFSMDGGESWRAFKKLGHAFVGTSMGVGHDGTLSLKGSDGQSITLDTPRFWTSGAAPLRYAVDSDKGASAAIFASAADRDIDSIAVIEDDGSLIYREFDLDNRSFEFRPNGDDTYNVVSISPAMDSAAGAAFQLFDDDARSVSIPFSFPFYSRSWQTMYVNSNGSVSFEGGDRSGFADLDAFFGDRPRISPLWEDFDPSVGPGVSLNATADKVVVTWNQTPLWNEQAPNTFQIVLFPDGRIRFNYGEMAATTGITGISNGFQTDGNYVVFSNISTLTGLAPQPIAQVFSLPDMNIARISQRFYQTHDDDFDQLVIFAASEYEPEVAGGAGAYFAHVKNDVRGIGLGLVDYTAVLGSAGRLGGIINMNALSQYQDDLNEPIPDTPDSATAISILGQEAGHQFGTYIRFRDQGSASSALLGRGFSHWSYFANSDASVMEGNAWQDNGNTTFTAAANTYRYNRLDQYLMGLRSASEVPPMMLITSPQPIMTGTITSLASTFGRTNNAIRDTTKDFGAADRLKGLGLTIQNRASGFQISHSSRSESAPAPGTISTDFNLLQTVSAAPGQTYNVQLFPYSPPQPRYYNEATGKFTGDNIVIRGARRDINISDIMEVEGERFPAKGVAPTKFAQALILVIPSGKTATPADLAKISAIRRAWESFFSAATDGLGVMSTEIKSGLSRISREINGGGVTSYASQGAPASATVGYARLESGAEPASGVVFLTGRSGARIVTETAVPALSTLRRARLYAERTTTANTGIAIAAPYLASAITLQLRGSDGALAATSSLNLTSGGQVARFANELFPSFNFPAAFRGSITLTATAPITVVTLRTFVNEAGEFLITTMPVSDLDSQQPTTSYLPHFAEGGQYGTDVILMNGGAAPIAGAVEFYARDGALQSLVVNGTNASSVRYTIPAGGTQVFSTAGGSGTLITGYVTVRADDGQAGAITRSIVNLRQSGKLVAMTGVYPSAPSSRARSFVDFTAGHDSGLAILNDSDRTANVRLSLYTTSGSPVQTPTTITMAARSQTSRFVSQLFPRIVSGFRGMMEISSDTPVQLVTLRSTSTSDRFLLAAFPAETLDVPRADRVLFFPDIVDGAGFSSEIFITNLGAAASAPKLSFISQSGGSLKFLLAPTR